MKPQLTVEQMQRAAASFAEAESSHGESTIYGTTDGKAIGTYLEHKFLDYLARSWRLDQGNSAKGIDLPGLNVDIKVTSIRQPQSSCPYKSARQKVFGLDYSLLVFVYEKVDDHRAKTGRLNILHVIFVDAPHTGDYQMTSGLRKIIENDGNRDDLIACMSEKNLPADEIELGRIAEELLAKPPSLGYLTISNALQWRLQYSRVIEKAGTVDGVVRLR
jgi:hypothetical protein